MYPAENSDEFNFIKGPIQFSVGMEGDSYKVVYRFGASGEVDRVSFNPGTMAMFERKIADAVRDQEPKVYPIALLQEAVPHAREIATPDNDKVAPEVHKVIQIFDSGDDPSQAAKVNGTLYAMNSKCQFFFKTEAFKDKSLVIPGGGLLEKFLGKTTGLLKVYTLPDIYYAENAQGDVLGWPRTAEVHKGFVYFNLDDDIITQVDTEAMREQLQFMRAAIPKDQTKVRLHFDPARKVFWFSSVDEAVQATSLPVAIDSIDTCKVEDPITANVNVSYLLDLFRGTKGARVEFRIRATPDHGKTTYLFRTIDVFLLDEATGAVVGGSGVEQVPEGTHQCAVTRYAPGRSG
jgi:hypothetical protein